LEIRLLEEDASKVGRMRQFHGRRVGQTVDVGLLKSWIHNCENKHGDRCEMVWWRNPGEVLPNTVRVVDVIRMAIIPAPPSCRYVTLSYVWGGPGEGYWTTQANIKQRSVPGGLDASTLPGTISDSIQLVRQLGERYLWIDALCIVQDDYKDKAVQISLMEFIYSSSAFTIFAASCASARDPLPGVLPGTRDPKQHIAKIQGLHLAVPLPVANEAVVSSVWNERGWTYQEVMLSRRRIFFTAHQVLFECRLDVCSEDIVSEPSNSSTMYSLATTGIGQVLRSSAPMNGRRDSYMDLYIQVIKEYTQRSLTVESDIVDAVAALLKAMTKGVKVTDGDFSKAFKFGMPLGRNLEEGLLWQPTANAHHSRRVPTRMGGPWPSWSWAAWRGAARYASAYVFVHMNSGRIGNNTSEINQSLVEQWYVVDDDGQPVRQYVEWQERIIEEDVDFTTNVPYMAPKGDIDPQQLIAENAPLLPGTLIFRTSYSRFDVTKADGVAGADAMDNYVVYSILSDIPRPSTMVGRIILPCSTPSPTSYEFVVLSRARRVSGSYDEERLGKAYSGCGLYVMAVQKMQDDGRLERVGVGVIFEQAWLNSMAGEKVVYLG
ncbi:HET-domain-containing protein, partial [Rhizopogon salebrosus TDB-379]